MLFQIIKPFFVAKGDALEAFDRIQSDLEVPRDLVNALLIGMRHAAENLDRLSKGFKAFVDGHRSVSPRTKSMLPIDAITSAIRIPSTILEVACRFPKLGVRMCTRYGLVVPSLTT